MMDKEDERRITWSLSREGTTFTHFLLIIGSFLTSTRGPHLKQLLLHQVLQRLNFSILRGPHILPATRKHQPHLSTIYLFIYYSSTGTTEGEVMKTIWMYIKYLSLGNQSCCTDINKIFSPKCTFTLTISATCCTQLDILHRILPIVVDDNG